MPVCRPDTHNQPAVIANPDVQNTGAAQNCHSQSDHSNKIDRCNCAGEISPPEQTGKSMYVRLPADIKPEGITYLSVKDNQNILLKFKFQYKYLFVNKKAISCQRQIAV